MRWAEIWGNLASGTFLVYIIPQPFSPTYSSKALKKVKGLKMLKI
jgi:hypothetical protein